MNVYRGQYPEIEAGGFTHRDGTIPFYNRVNALLREDMTVLEFGAGRGQAAEDPVPYRRQLLTMKGKVREVIGLDVDPVVLENPIVDRALVFDGNVIPLEDESVDLVLSDWTFEHLPEPDRSAAELYRVLKPGGWVCARTPYKYSIIATGSRLVPNRLHARLLQKIQPGSRQAKDVFPTVYGLNTPGALRRHFQSDQWRRYSYSVASTLSYHFGLPAMVRLLSSLQNVEQPIGGEMLPVFMQRRFDAARLANG